LFQLLTIASDHWKRATTGLKSNPKGFHKNLKIFFLHFLYFHFATNEAASIAFLFQLEPSGFITT